MLGAARALRADARAVAIVGARGASLQAVTLARALAAELARDHVIISGGAIGIDGAAHLGALDARGETVVVLGSGIDVYYPARHVTLFERVVACGAGLLLSCFPPSSEPKRWTFPARNALIAALSCCVVVVEAGSRSGSLQTARLARELAVPVAAMVGSAGTAQLIAGGATPVACADDVRALLAGMPANARAPHQRAAQDEALEAEARELLSALRASQGARRVSELAVVLGIESTRAASLLLRLELAGYVEALAGARYRAVQR